MRVFAYKKLKAILDLETIVCLMRTLLYGEIEIHANQCQVCTTKQMVGGDVTNAGQQTNNKQGKIGLLSQ